MSDDIKTGGGELKPSRKHIEDIVRYEASLTRWAVFATGAMITLGITLIILLGRL